MSEEKGMYEKYSVINNLTGERVKDCFVLKPTKDPAARAALRTYAEATRGTLISDHIIHWLAVIGGSGNE